MEVIHLLSEEEYDDDIIFVEHRVTTKTDLTKSDSPLQDTTNIPSYGKQKHDSTETHFGEVQVLGELKVCNALMDYPHFRFQCAIETFNEYAKECNQQHCDMCFCYICDIPATNCKQWKSHCSTSDQQLNSVSKRKKTLRARSRRTAQGLDLPR